MRSPATAYLSSFLNYETQSLQNKDVIFNLARIERLLAELHHPQRKYPVIHVVGTKGKGSTCLFLSSMLREAGLKVGIYTSPHLYSYAERIRILRPKASFSKEENIFSGKISQSQLEKMIKEIRPKVEEVRRVKALGPLTFFEVYTALAFYFFAQQKVDVVVAEAGLGGRFDATNMAPSEICVFSPISYDHTQVLGSTLKEIAQEKAAIIKASTRIVFSAPQKAQARLVIEKQAKKFGLKVLMVGREIRYHMISQNSSGVMFSLKGLYHSWPKLCSLLLGEHQVVNASLAAAVVEYFLKHKDRLVKSAVTKGIAKARWPARFEILRQNPFVVIDSAHNEDSARRLAQTVRAIFPKQRIILLFGASKDKDIKAILKELSPVSDQIILTHSQHPRSFDFSEHGKKFLKARKVCMSKNAQEGFQLAKTMACTNDVILIAGSVFLAAEIRKICIAKI